MKIGFIGLGVMGGPMAGHLLRAGHDLTVHTRSQEKADELVAAGAVWVDAPRDMSDVDVVITMLPDSPEVEEVLFGEDGASGSLPAGSLVIDCSTIAPEAATRIGARLAERGVLFVDAPVSGGETGAIGGNLAVMLGGESRAVELALQVLEPVAAAAAHVGPVGSGQLVKAANQMIVAGNIALVGEALSLLGRAEVDVPAALEVLGGGLASSRVLETKASKMLERDFAPGFRIDLHYKDLRIALAAADQAGIAAPVTGVVAQLVVALRAAGEGGEDHAALIKAVERLSAIPADGH
ncbi:NAD(P)-dependent oxidoreductase [Microbacterium sp. gxy059]|uniref:Wt8.3 n=1 Tax=uncultured bacterium WT8 TaxID=1393214 RepID=U3PYE3_9BACT|nr:Wt8.3 [uncultured bacterium WT8]